MEGKFLESQQQSDYARNIQQFVDEGTDLIVTVGFLLGVDTATAAKANPEQKFAIVDYSYPDCFGDTAVEGETCGSAAELPNVLGLTFDTDQAAFLAGYAAAASTQTGTVATFGGINIPPVTIFMKGFEAGVNYYNEQKGADVQVLGWSTADNDGVFTGNFESTDDGRANAEILRSGRRRYHHARGWTCWTWFCSLLPGIRFLPDHRRGCRLDCFRQRIQRRDFHQRAEEH